jgi:hypothetical protein
MSKIPSKLDRLKSDLSETQFFLLRLEKEGATERMPFYQLKIDILEDSIKKIEKPLDILVDYELSSFRNEYLLP